MGSSLCAAPCGTAPGRRRRPGPDEPLRPELRRVFFADWSALGCIFRWLARSLPPSLGRSPFDVSRGEGAAAAQSRPCLRSALGPSAGRRFFSLLSSLLPYSPSRLSLPFRPCPGRKEGGGSGEVTSTCPPRGAGPPPRPLRPRGGGEPGQSPEPGAGGAGPGGGGSPAPRRASGRGAGGGGLRRAEPGGAAAEARPGPAGPAPPLKPEPGPLPSQVSKQERAAGPHTPARPPAAVND